jgi:ketosteroid isomerase-like protein
LWTAGLCHGGTAIRGAESGFQPESSVTGFSARKGAERLYDAYARGDGEAVAALIHDDIDWVVYNPVQVFAFSGPRRGKAQVLEVLRDIASDYALQSYVPEIIVAERDRAAVLSNAAFLQRTTNRVLRLRLVNFLRFQDEKIIEFREFSDTFDTVEQALGRWIEV